MRAHTSELSMDALVKVAMIWSYCRQCRWLRHVMWSALTTESFCAFLFTFPWTCSLSLGLNFGNAKCCRSGLGRAVSPLRVLPVQHVGTQSAWQRERERLNSTLRWSIYQPLWNNVMSTSPKMIATQPQAKHVRQKCFGGGREVSKAICQIALPMIELLIWIHTYATICLLRENYSVFRCAMKHRLLWERIRQIKRDPF